MSKKKKSLRRLASRKPRTAALSSSYYYLIEELVLSHTGNRQVSSMEFRKAWLPEAKTDAEHFYINRRKRIEYWLMLGTYELAAGEKAELALWLVETQEGKTSRYLLRSINTTPAQADKANEQRVLAHYMTGVAIDGSTKGN